MSKIKQAAEHAEFMRHFSTNPSRKLYKFVREEALGHSAFFFYKRMPKSTIYGGTCSYCKKEYVVRDSKPLEHNKWWRCEKCKTAVMLKAAGRGRGKLVDRAYAVWYERSAIDQNAIVATGYKVTLDYRVSIVPEIEFVPVTRYLFQYGQGARYMVRDHWTTGWSFSKQIHFGDGWEFRNRPTSIVGKYYFTQYSQQSKDSVKEAVKGTPFAHSEWHKFWSDSLDACYIFSSIAKYPFIEYLVKSGLYTIASKLVRGEPTYGAINLRGKTPQKILGLSRQEFKAWKAAGSMEAETLRAYKWCRDRRVPIDWTQACCFGPVICQKYNYEKVQAIVSRVPLQQFIRYAWNQYQKDKKHYRELQSVITTYRDYLSEARELEMDMSAESTLYPNSLRSAHQKTLAAIKIKSDELTNSKIVALQKRLKPYVYDEGGLTIRPIRDVGELFAEGAALSHCVGRYADRYASGQIILLCLRKKEHPEEPFYTAEIAGGRLVQCRGLYNRAMSPEVQAFMDSFMSYLKTKSNKKSEVAV